MSHIFLSSINFIVQYRFTLPTNMAFRNFIIAALILFGAWACQATSRTLPEASMLERHDRWMTQYGRVYKDEAEKSMCFQIFKDNVKFIEEFNEDGNQSYKLGINEFADQTNVEFQASRNGYKMNANSRTSQTTLFRYENVTAVPSSMDWRKNGAVTPIKDQGQCGKIIYSYLLQSIDVYVCLSRLTQ